MSTVLLLAFFVQSVMPVRAELVLPSPGQMVALSPAFNPPVLKGIKVYPDNPLRFDFILDKGDDKSTDEQIKIDSTRLIKYFLASLTIPEKDLWVNLSPYEKDRIVPEAFGQTEMGRDLLAQDYLLKQITSSLLYPEGDTGKKFWQKVYALAQEKYGTTDIPVDTFNKVWIVPEKAVVYENGKVGAAYVTESRLKVMLETDYLADELARSGGSLTRPAQDMHEPIGSVIDRPLPADSTSTSDIAKSVLREIVIPVLEQEVNEGKNFAQLRQVYQSLILATWYKNKIRVSILSQVYVDRNRLAGVNIEDPRESERIWARYTESFRKGVYNQIKEEQDMFSGENIPRKYFSGGFDFDMKDGVTVDPSQAFLEGESSQRSLMLNVDLVSENGNPSAGLPARSLDAVDRAQETGREFWRRLEPTFNAADQGWIDLSKSEDVSHFINPEDGRFARNWDFPELEFYDITGQFPVPWQSVNMTAVHRSGEIIDRIRFVLVNSQDSLTYVMTARRKDSDRWVLYMEQEDQQSLIKARVQSLWADLVDIVPESSPPVWSLVKDKRLAEYFGAEILRLNGTPMSKPVFEVMVQDSQVTRVRISEGTRTLNQQQFYWKLQGDDHWVRDNSPLEVFWADIRQSVSGAEDGWHNVGKDIGSYYSAQSGQNRTLLGLPDGSGAKYMRRFSAGRLLAVKVLDGEIVAVRFSAQAKASRLDMPTEEELGEEWVKTQDGWRSMPDILRAYWRDVASLAIVLESVPEERMNDLEGSFDYNNPLACQKVLAGLRQKSSAAGSEPYNNKFRTNVWLPVSGVDVSDFIEAGYFKPGWVFPGSSMTELKDPEWTRLSSGTQQVMISDVMIGSQGGIVGLKFIGSHGEDKQNVIWRKNGKFWEATKSDLKEEINDVVASIGEEHFQYLAVRYGMDLKEIIFQLVAARMEGQYDEKEIKRLIDARMLDVIGGFEMSTGVLGPAQKGEAAPHSLKVMEPFFMTGEEIASLSGNFEQWIKGLNLDDMRVRALAQMARQQSTAMLQQLEEKYLFKKYSLGDPSFTIQTMIADLELTLKAAESDILRDAIRAVLADLRKADQIDERLRSAGVATRLHPYQLMGVVRMLDNKGVLLADEMGVGKTLEVLATFLASESGEMLILAPARVLSRWVDDLARHTDRRVEIVNLSNVPLSGLISGREHLIEHQFSGKGKRLMDQRGAYLYGERPAPLAGAKRIILVNYEAMLSYENYRTSHALASPKVEFVAMDEVHLVKRRSGKWAEVVLGDGKTHQGIVASEYRILMSGTPLENRVSDMLGYLQYLARGRTDDESAFILNLDSRMFSDTFATESLSRLSLLHSYLASHMVRRLKDDVVSGLPGKVFVTVGLDPVQGTMSYNGTVVQLDGDYTSQARLYQEALEQPGLFEKKYVGKGEASADFDLENGPIKPGDTKQTLVRLEQVATHPMIFDAHIPSMKFAAAGQLIAERVREGKRVVVFTDYRQASEAFRDYLIAQYGIEVGYMDGGVDPLEREKVTRDFQDTNGRARVLVATVKTAGIGIELTNADTVIFLNNLWKPSDYFQAIDRTHRYDPLRNKLGKIIEIINLELQMPVSIDFLKWQILRMKYLLAEMVINGNLSPEILDALRNAEVRVGTAIREGADEMATYETTLSARLQDMLHEALARSGEADAREAWDHMAAFYSLILQHKQSFLANMASLDHLSGDMFPDLKRTEAHLLEVLDVASGPSVLERAYRRNLSELNARGFYVDITDMDLSPEMLRQGVYRPGKQLHGSIEALGELKEASYDLVNVSYAFRFVAHPAQFFTDVYKILKAKGMVVLILPQTNQIPEQFRKALERIGYEMVYPEGTRLLCRLDKQYAKAISDEYGADFLADVADQAKGGFTYLVARKTEKPVAGGVAEDSDFLLQVPIKSGISRERLQRPVAPVIRLLPETATVTGDVVFDQEEPQDRLLSNPGDRRNFVVEWELIEGMIISYKENSGRAFSRIDEAAINLQLARFYDLLWEGQRSQMLTREIKIQLLALLNKSFQKPLVNSFITRAVKAARGEASTSHIARVWSLLNSDASQQTRIDKKGGIDFDPDRMELQSRSNGDEIKFKPDPVLLRQLQDTRGMSPVIVKIQPVGDLKFFLGINIG